MEPLSVPFVSLVERCPEEAQMELLFQAWDELDDALAALGHVAARYVVDELGAVTTAALDALRRLAREAATMRRRRPRMRAA